MLTVSVKGTKNINVSSDISFGLVSAPPERELCSGMFSCRDYLNDYLQLVSKGLLEAKGGTTCLCTSKTEPDLKKLRLLIATKLDSNIKKKLFFAKKIINIIEKELKFNKTSKITTVKMEISNPNFEKGKYQFFLVTGPEEWLYSPQTLSFVTFIFKSCFYTELDLIKKHEEIAAVEDIKNYFKEVLSKASESENSYTASSYTTGYVKIFLENIDFFISKFNKIFITGSLEERFPPHVYSVHSEWGVMSFFTRGSERQKNLHERYIIARDEFKKEKE
jgi:hypothetical protein